MPEWDTNQNASVYRITIHGNIDPKWSCSFKGMTVFSQDGSPVTTLTGRITDQAELRGILNKLWDLNLIVISIYQLQDRI